jgi:hypothetical protein
MVKYFFPNLPILGLFQSNLFATEVKMLFRITKPFVRADFSLNTQLIKGENLLMTLCSNFKAQYLRDEKKNAIKSYFVFILRRSVKLVGYTASNMYI